MKLNANLIWRALWLGWTGTTVATSVSTDCWTLLHDSMEAICSASTCVIPTSTAWGAAAVTLTEYVTVTEPSTVPVPVPTTINNTVIEITYPPTSTELVTLTEVSTTTETDLSTLTTITTAPIVLTVTSTSTLQITLCETRDVNPTYTAPLPILTDSTWGCPPGYICKPPQVNCNFERGLPSVGYSCAPQQCVPVPNLLPISFWGDPVTGNESPLTNDTLFFDISSGYFNMNPLDYDLSYNIFFQTSVSTYTTTIYPPGATPAPNPLRKRQAQIYVPAVCYDECNDAMLEAQSMGKTPALCLAGSAFSVTTSMCELCIKAHATDDTASFVQIQPQFQQFLDYCAKLAITLSSTTLSEATVIPSVTTMVISETVTLSSSTYTFLIPTSTETSGYVTVSDITVSVIAAGSTAVSSTTSSPPSVLGSSTGVPSSSTSLPAATSTSKPSSASSRVPSSITSSIFTSAPSSSMHISSGSASVTAPAAPPVFTGAASGARVPTAVSSSWMLWLGSVLFSLCNLVYT